MEDTKTEKRGTTEDAIDAGCEAFMDARNAMRLIDAADLDSELSGEDLDVANEYKELAKSEAAETANSLFVGLVLASGYVVSGFGPSVSPYTDGNSPEGCAAAIEEAADLMCESGGKAARAAEILKGNVVTAGSGAHIAAAVAHARNACEALEELCDALAGGDGGDDGGPQPQLAHASGSAAGTSSAGTTGSAGAGSSTGGDADPAPSAQEAWRLAVINQEANERPLADSCDDDDEKDEDGCELG